MLPDLVRLEATVEVEKRAGKGSSNEYRRLYDLTLEQAEILAGLRPVTLPGFVAKARIARYHLFLGIQIARDLDALAAGSDNSAR